MPGRAIGRSGCAASALLALKLFGGKIRKSGMNWGEALDFAMERELDDDISSRPWMETRPIQGRWKGRKGSQGMEPNREWDQRYGGRRPRRSQGSRRPGGRQGGQGGYMGGQGGAMGGRQGGMTRPGGGRMRPAGDDYDIWKVHDAAQCSDLIELKKRPKREGAKSVEQGNEWMA